MRRGVYVTVGMIAFASLAVPAIAESQDSFSGNQRDVAEGHLKTTPEEGFSPQLTPLPTFLAQASPDVGQLIQSKSCKGCNFSNANLSGLDLSGADLSGANLSNADLSNTNLTGADLTGANLYIAKLASSILTNAKLTKTNWTGAKAEQVNVSGADLSDATLGYANLTGANLMGANLSRVSAGDATFSGANFNQANLTQAKLRNANLSGATFSQANLTNAELTNADLSNADLKDANVTGANLAGAQLIQARLPEGTDATTLATTPAPSTTGTTSGGEKTAYTPTPLEKPPIRLFNLETANQQPAGAISFTLGLRNFLNSQGNFGEGGGLGRQVNPFHFDWGVSDRWQVSLSGNLFSDKLLRSVSGDLAELKYFSAAAAVKYQFLKQEKLALSVMGSAELLNIRTDRDRFLTGNLESGFSGPTIFAGSLKVPLTYSVSDQFQVHLTPGISFFQDKVKNGEFYGTLFEIGAGASWQPAKRLNLFADVHFPLGPGGNSIRSRDASVFKSVVWSGGLRFLVNPAVGLDIYATNAFGTTPATQILTALPDGDQVAIAAMLNFSPDIGQNYAPDFRNKPRVELTDRDKQLLLDGFTIPTADTLLPRTLRVRAGTGAGTSGNVATGLTNDVQLELLAGNFNGPISNGLDPDPLKVGAAAKIRFLDQVQGDPFSLSGRVSFAQTVGVRNGFSEGGLIFQYRPIPRLALMLEPKAAVFAGDQRFGTALGFNVQLWKGLQFIGEYTPILAGEGKTGVWSTGVRYLDPKLGLGVDVYGSNAAGLDSIGGLLGRPDASVGFNVHWLFGH